MRYPARFGIETTGGLAGRVPDESALYELVLRRGPNPVAALTREAIGRSVAQTGFMAG